MSNGMTKAIVHDFCERLEFSDQLSDEAAWVDFYQAIWPDLLTAARIDKDCKWQRWGVDRQILLPGGRQLFIDEKKRERNKETGILYSDFLIEEWSVWIEENNRRNRIGWTLDAEKRIDFLAYAIPELGSCYLLPFEILRLTCTRCLPEWKKRSRMCVARNSGYNTINWPVSWNTLFQAMRAEMSRQFGGKLALPLPNPIRKGNHTLYPWKSGGVA